MGLHSVSNFQFLNLWAQVRKPTNNTSGDGQQKSTSTVSIFYILGVKKGEVSNRKDIYVAF